MKKTIERVSGKARFDLPPAISREIGRILVHWAYFEHIVQEMVWQPMEVNEKIGRIAVREPRVTDRLEMLNDVIRLRDAEWNTELYKSILARAKIYAARRDLLSHGIWGTHPLYPWRNRVWHVQLARGSWPKSMKELVEGSKKITPEMVPIKLSDLRETTNEIVRLIGDLRELRASAVGP